MENIKVAIVNSLGVSVYVAIVAMIMNNAESLFGMEDSIISVVGFLMLFVLSAGVVGSLVIGKPIFLYLDGKKKEAINLLFGTLGCLAVLTVLLLAYLAIK